MNFLCESSNQEKLEHIRAQGLPDDALKLVKNEHELALKFAQYLTILNMKPLFCPLKTKFYNRFKYGFKTYEMRIYGACWNDKTCPVGRRVTLSKGYGNIDRIHRIITKTERKYFAELSAEDRIELKECFPYIADHQLIILVHLGNIE